MTSVPEISLLSTRSWQDYELVDSGKGRKLERFGKFYLIRPESQAWWARNLGEKKWAQANAEFVPTSGDETGGRWKFLKPVDDHWLKHYNHLTFEARLSNSRQVGVFPEQAVHWDWLVDVIGSVRRPLKVLNLFGYTGLASLAASTAGAAVTHVDASKKAVSWARTNQAHSNLTDKPIRWIVDDALKYVQREERRGSLYDGIIMDPPKFGRGPKGEIWDSLDMLPNLLESCTRVLCPTPLFIIITAYTIRASSLSLYNILNEKIVKFQGSTECGELIIGESNSDRFLSTSIFARWSAPFQRANKA